MEYSIIDSAKTGESLAENWHTIDQLAELSGLFVETLKHGEKNLAAIMQEMSVNIDVNTRLGGYHNTQKFYSDNVLKALKQYQMRNAAPNALKDKETAIGGNVSFTVNQTIDTLMDNPDTLQLMLQKSLERNVRLGIENMELKEVVEEMKPKAIAYDDFIDRSKFCNFRDGAAYMGVPQTELMNLLKSRYIYKTVAGEYRAYSEYSRLFALRPFILGDKTKQQLMLTIEGLEFFKGKFNGKGGVA